LPCDLCPPCPAVAGGGGLLTPVFCPRQRRVNPGFPATPVCLVRTPNLGRQKKDTAAKYVVILFPAMHKELALKLQELERRIEAHDEQIVAIFEAIRALMAPSEKPRKKIGFEVKEAAARYGKGAKKK
jgi:hypothetical protein